MHNINVNLLCDNSINDIFFSFSLLELFFSLFRCQDKLLRSVRIYDTVWIIFLTSIYMYLTWLLSKNYYHLKITTIIIVLKPQIHVLLNLALSFPKTPVSLRYQTPPSCAILTSVFVLYSVIKAVGMRCINHVAIKTEVYKQRVPCWEIRLHN